MIDERFSASSFSKRGIDSEAARALADLLADEIEREMQSTIEQAFYAIVERLNEMGHNLKPESIGLGELAFRDDHTDVQGYHCKLRVALDLVISTGYAHLNSPDD